MPENIVIYSNTTEIYDINNITNNLTDLYDINSVLNIISENANNGDEVGITAKIYDFVNPNSQITYNLTNDAGGRFQINSDNGVVTIKDSNLLSFKVSTHMK